jgi:predicted protein tyrosine phosphatase
MLAEQQYNFSPGAERAFAEYLDLRMSQPSFANARSVRNALERMRLRHANRLVALNTVDREQLQTIEESDVRGSRVFALGHVGGEATTAPSSSAGSTS